MVENSIARDIHAQLAKRIIAALAEVSLIANDDGCNDSYRTEIAAETIVTVILNEERYAKHVERLK